MFVHVQRGLRQEPKLAQRNRQACVSVCCVSGSGGNAVEAIADLLSIARLPPGHDPGAGCGVATLPGSGGTWPLDILVCSAAHWPLRRTSSRANGQTIHANEQAAETAPPGHGPAPPGHGPADHGDHGDHDRPRRSRQVTAVTAGHGRMFRTGSRRTPRTPHSPTILSHDPYG